MNSITKYLPLVLTLLSFFLSNYCYGITITNILVENNDRTEKETILSYLPVSVGDDVNQVIINDLTKMLFKSQYFNDIKISIDKNGVMTVFVKENPVVNKIIFNGMGSSEIEAIKGELFSREKWIYSKEKIRKDIDQITMLYRKTGRFDTQVVAKIQTLEQNRVNIVFDVDKGSVSRIKRVNFFNNYKISSDDLYDILPFKQKKWWNIFSLGSRFDEDEIEVAKFNIINYYKNKGYANVDVSNSYSEYDQKSSNFVINFFIEEGEKYKFGETNLIAEIPNFSSNKEKLIKKIAYKKNELFNLAKIQQTIDIINEQISTMGYAFAKVDYQINYRGEFADVDITINPMQKVYIGKIKITNNTKSYDYVIRREMMIREGDMYDSSKISKSKDRLQVLGYFENVQINEIQTDDNGVVDLEVYVAELKKFGLANFSLGYSSFEGLILGLGLDLLNIGGTGKDVRFSLSRSLFIKSYSIGMTIPHIANTDMKLDFNVFYTQFGSAKFFLPFRQESKGFSLSTSMPLATRLWLSFIYTYRQDNIELYTGNASKIFSDSIGNLSSSIYGYSLFYDKRNSFLRPTKGYSVRFANNYAGLDRFGNQKFAQFDFSTALYQKIISENFILSFTTKSGLIQSLGGNVGYSNKYTAGYYDLRGFAWSGIGPRIMTYNADGTQSISALSFRGLHYFVATIDLSFPLINLKDYGFFGSVFYDVGYLSGNSGGQSGLNNNGNFEKLIDSRSFRSAIGAGVLWVSPMGPIRIDYAVPVKYQEYDNKNRLTIRFDAGI